MEVEVSAQQIGKGMYVLKAASTEQDIALGVQPAIPEIFSETGDQVLLANNLALLESVAGPDFCGGIQVEA